MRLLVTKSAEKAIKKLDKVTRARIIAGIKNLPSGDIKKLKGYVSAYRLRIGDYRVIYTFDGYTITISDVLPRGESYKHI